MTKMTAALLIASLAAWHPARAQSFQEIQMRQQMQQMEDEQRREADQRWIDNMNRNTNSGQSSYYMPPVYGR